MAERATTIVVPGFMGSTLVDAAGGRTMWGTAGLFLRDLRRMRLNESGTADAEPGVRIVPGADFWPVYRPLMRDLRRDGRRVLFFAYDWRRSVVAAVGELSRFVEEKALRDDIDLVTHSMGGLVAALWLASGGRRRLRRMVGLAFPAGGVEMAVSALLLGYSKLAFYNIRANRALVRRLAAGIPSLYEMLPPLPGIYEPACWPLELEISADLLRNAAKVRGDLESGFGEIIRLTAEGRVALISGVGRRTDSWRSERAEGELLNPELRGVGSGDGWILDESSRLEGVPAYCFRPRLLDAFSLGVFFLFNYTLGSHPILPMYRRVRKAALEFLRAGKIESLEAFQPCDSKQDPSS